ncbi:MULTISPECIES: dynamin family protein [unclassified Microcoleus]|uniref:dynamin family protein n=1 Tax=unclassified Microcoleus TaxID=2642155 RepID=UPI002FD344AB
MTQKPHQCENLEAHVNRLLGLLDKEPSLRGQHNTAAIKTSRDKAIAPRFEIVFAGTYSAGKSMLINALLGQDLLYSSTGHATGIECYIEYAKSLEEERVDLTFLSISEVQEEVNDRCKTLKLPSVDITQEVEIQKLREECKKITEDHKGSGKTEKEDEAEGLLALLKGFGANRPHIDQSKNNTKGMEDLNFSNKKAHEYARRGINSAVLKGIKYYCHYPLLEDGNVLVDLPGIDAPVLRDAKLTYRKVEDPNTSAVICVMKADQEGEIEPAEKKLTEAIRENSGIGDRVFYVFNRIDKTWRDPKLKQALDNLISEDFSNTRRGIYETSALLGFWASQLENTSESDRWGLNSIFTAETVKGSDEAEGIPLFVREFLDYCDSDKLPRSKFRILRDNAKSKNEQYIDILNSYKNNIFEQLLQDSGIQEFSNAITRYLTEEKRPELFANLASDISELCNDLREFYLEERRQWKKKPANIAEMTERDLVQIEKEVWEVGEAFYRQIEEEIKLLVMDSCEDFQHDFNNLRQNMQENLTELIKNFSILDAFANTCRNHRHVTAPLVAILGQAFYDIANGLEDVLVKESEILIVSFFQRLIKRVRKQKYHRQLGNLLLGDDCGIVQDIQDIQIKIIEGVKVLASAECVFYIIESPDLYDYEDSVWLYQFRETLQEASNSRDVKRMVEAEEPIRQLLEIDFQAKFTQTIEVNFGSKIIKMLNKYLLSMAENKRQLIWQQSARARANKRQAIEKDAQAKIDKRSRKLREVEEKIGDYNQAVAGINSCLEAMKLEDYKLPTIPEDSSSGTPFFTDVNLVESNNMPPESTSSFDSANDSSATQNYSETNPVESDDSPEPGASANPLARPNYQAAQSESSKKLERGQLVKAQITGFQPYGVFVDVEGTKGLLHIRNVSQLRIEESLEDLFEIGQSIKALIDNPDDGKGRMSLSTKVLENYEGEILENMEQVMADAEARVSQARKKLFKP